MSRKSEWREIIQNAALTKEENNNFLLAFQKRKREKDKWDRGNIWSHNGWEFSRIKEWQHLQQNSNYIRNLMYFPGYSQPYLSHCAQPLLCLSTATADAHWVDRGRYCLPHWLLAWNYQPLTFGWHCTTRLILKTVLSTTFDLYELLFCRMGELAFCFCFWERDADTEQTWGEG